VSMQCIFFILLLCVEMMMDVRALLSSFLLFIKFLAMKKYAVRRCPADIR
jgi:hypothetical protein